VPYSPKAHGRTPVSPFPFPFDQVRYPYGYTKNQDFYHDYGNITDPRLKVRRRNPASTVTVTLLLTSGFDSLSAEFDV